MNRFRVARWFEGLRLIVSGGILMAAVGIIFALGGDPDGWTFIATGGVIALLGVFIVRKEERPPRGE